MAELSDEVLDEGARLLAIAHRWPDAEEYTDNAERWLVIHAPALIAAARAALSLEWAACGHCMMLGRRGDICPWCSGHKPNHEDGCVRAALHAEPAGGKEQS